MKLNIYNITLLYYISLIYSSKSFKLPNRIEIIRDFENLLNTKYINNNLNSRYQNKIQLSKNKLFLKLQNVIFNKIDNYSNKEDLKIKLLNDINYNLNKEINIYEIANVWCMKKYGLI